MPSVPRLAVGTSEYLHALSLRDHSAVRWIHCRLRECPLPLALPLVELWFASSHVCRKGGRVVGSHWDLDASAADPPLRVGVCVCYRVGSPSLKQA